jgi:hypothetical protein
MASAPPRVRFLGTLYPEEVDTMLTYQATINLKNVSGLYWAYPLFTNAPYDVDPSLGSTATIGMAEFSAAYQRYRVLRYTADVRFINVGIFPTSVMLIHSNTLLSTAGGNATNLEPYIGNLTSQRAVCGHSYSGTSERTLKSTHSISQISGALEATTDTTYSSQTSSVPTNLTYLEIGATIHDPVGSYLVNGVVAVVILKMVTRFYERKNLTN